MYLMKQRVLWCLVILFYKAIQCEGIDWKNIKCSGTDDQEVTEGPEQLRRFPWLGIIQHSFYMAEKTRFAVTAGILIHPGYVLAPAEDIGRIPPDQIWNNTKFIVWGKSDEKYALDIYDYSLHPDFTEKVTVATVALLQLRNWASGRRIPPVEPVCLPLKGIGSFDNLYAVKFNDANNKITKEVFKMNYILDKDCAEFYYRAQLTYEKMAPVHPLCASVEAESRSCIWDNGAVLVTRVNYGYWTLLGFGVRGPGCGAPARFASTQNMLEWIDESITSRPLEDVPEGYNAFFLRQMSPWELHLYKADTQIPTDYGQCQKGLRGNVIFKDNAEILSNKNVGQGFYFVSVYDIVMYSCAVVRFDTMARSNTALWVEHHCHQQVAGMAWGMKRPDRRKYECFVYYKSIAFVEFRFTFSFKATISMTLYGVNLERGVLNPWMSSETTHSWWPTDKFIKEGKFVPYYLWYWYL